MKLTSILITLLFAFTLAACGGGGGSSAPATTTPPDDTMTPPDDTTPVDPMVSNDMSLAIPAGTYMIDAGDSMDAGMGESEVTLSCSAAADCAFTVADDGTVDATSGETTVALSAAAQQAISERETMEANAEIKAEAERVAGLIGPGVDLADADVRTASTGDQSIVTLSPPPADDNFSMPVFQAATAATDTALSAVKFTASTDMPATIDGWTGGVYTHTSEDGMTTHKVTKYNDKAPDEAEKYMTFFGDPGTGSTNAASETHRAGIAVSGLNANGVSLNLDVAAPTGGETDQLAGNHGLFTGNFGPTTEGTYNFPGNAEITGTFRGVPGTFECTSPCSSTHDKDGNLSALTGTWTFEPNGVRDASGDLLANDATATPPTTALTDALDAIMVPGVKQDADYMIFGYWEQSVTDDEGETTETMLPFADGKRDYGNLSGRTGGAVAGTAKYEGSATGLYMKKTITPQGGVDPNGPFASGQFTADAMLEANFGGNNVAVNHQWSITGTISNLMDGDTAIDEDWKVNLNRRMLDLDNNDATPTTPQKNMYGSASILTADGDGTVGTFGGVTHGGTLDDPSNSGTWSGTFHGDSANADQPTYATGIFDAHFTNGHVRGAFGANKVDTQ